MQHNYKIKLNNIDDVKRLNTILCTIPCEFDINIGKGAIDAKSIMGLMALDISKPLVLTAVCSDNILINNINEKIKEFTV